MKMVNGLNLTAKQKKIKWMLVLLSVGIFTLLFAGAALAEVIEDPTFDSFHGYVRDSEGEPVAWQSIQAYIDGQLKGTLNFSDSRQEIGQYGIPTDSPFVGSLIVNGSGSYVGRAITFKVVADGRTFTAQTASQVYYEGYFTDRRVDLTVDIPVNTSTGLAKLEKALPGDPEPDHSSTVVAVYQGASQVAGAVTDSGGAYAVNDLPAGAYNFVFHHNSGSWKKTTLPVNVVEGPNELGTVTLYLGDMNRDAAINILDLLWMAARMGQVQQGNEESQRADVNRDGNVNILDLLRVAQNIGK